MKAIVKKILLVFCFTGASGFGLLLNSQPPLRQEVMDTVRCRNVPGQSYALFIPRGYDEKRSWPVILIFDPGARGKTGVEAFLEAGRKYGFILACSNNSRNGPMEANFTAAAAMLQDVTGRFNADPKRIYASGFSGGSRFSMAFAVAESRISGVIGCGAGLPGDRNILPQGDPAFLYYGIAGTRDMNYLELYDLSEFFKDRGSIISYFRTFTGDHRWPAPELLTESVEWLILQSMNRKIIPSDQAFISLVENKTKTLISTSMSGGNITDAVRYMRQAARDFGGTSFGSEMSRLLAETERSADYRAAVRKWNKMVETEQESKEKYMRYLGEILNAASIPDSASAWWKKEVLSLTRIREKGSTGNSEMASRLLNFISIAGYEQGMSYYRSNHPAQAAFLFEICTFSDSENPNNYFNLAKVLALSGKQKKSLDALSAAVTHGFALRNRIESDPAFASLKNDARYKELMMKMK